MIEDNELRELFKVESDEHLQRLEEGLLYLESTPDDPAMLEEVFRRAHSLKGAARLVGVESVASVTHRFEDMLGAAKRGQVPLTSDTIDRLCHAVDAVRKLVHEAVTGQPSGIDPDSLLADLPENTMAAPPEAPQNEPDTAVAPQVEAPTAVSPAVEAPAPETIPAPAVEAPAPEALPIAAAQEANPSDSAFRIETVRVKPSQLDVLLTLAGELRVLATRSAQLHHELSSMNSLLEEWERDTFACRPLLGEAERSSGDGAVSRLLSFQERSAVRLEQCDALFHSLRAAVDEENAQLDKLAGEMEERIRSLRLLPLSTLFALFPRMVRDLAREQSKEVRLILAGEETQVDKRILEEMKDPLTHLLRNAVDHGVETPAERERQGKPPEATIHLKGSQTDGNILIEVTDDGRGLDYQAIRQTALQRRQHPEQELDAMEPEQLQKLIFTPGFSTSEIVTDISGRGVGLDVVRKNVEVLKGSIRVDSVPGTGCRFQVRLPITLATTRILLVEAAGRKFALPVENVSTSRFIQQADFFPVEGHNAVLLDGEPVSIVRLDALLGIPRGKSSEPGEGAVPCIFLSLDGERLGLLVDALCDEQEVVLKPLGKPLKRVRNIAGTTVLGNGEICTVLNPYDLLRSTRRQEAVAIPESVPEASPKTILLAEDSITTRTQEKRILESSGYEVVTAVDGLDAYNKLSTRVFAALVSDVQMPHLDGFALAAKVRQDNKYKEMPIILVTALASEEDKKRGIEVGANAYITKGGFDQRVLLDTLRRLVW